MGEELRALIARYSNDRRNAIVELATVCEAMLLELGMLRAEIEELKGRQRPSDTGRRNDEVENVAIR